MGFSENGGSRYDTGTGTGQWSAGRELTVGRDDCGCGAARWVRELGYVTKRGLFSRREAPQDKARDWAGDFTSSRPQHGGE